MGRMLRGWDFVTGDCERVRLGGMVYNEHGVGGVA